MTILHTRRLSLTASLFTVAALVLGAAGTAHAQKDHADAVQLYPRDLFVIVGSTLRNPDASTHSKAQLFNVAGVPLGITWGAWGQASATSTMRVSSQLFGGYKSEATISLTGLIPNGVYSVFYGTLGPDSENPLCPNVERTLPFPTPDTSTARPDSSSFIADWSGNATFFGRVSGNLLAAYQTYITIVYHADRTTYQSLPNRGEYLTQGSNCRSSFGEDAFRHLMIMQQW